MASNTPQIRDGKPVNTDPEKDSGAPRLADMANSDGASLAGSDILSLQDVDPALNMKMHLVNNVSEQHFRHHEGRTREMRNQLSLVRQNHAEFRAIDEIGWTPYHLKLFFLNGFGYAVDSMILLFQSIVAGSAFREFGEVGYANGLTIAAYVGMLTGAIFWGFGADIIGRKYAFNVSLFICSCSCIVAGAMPNWPALGTFIALLGFGGGGNLVMDTTVFLEFLPSSKQWLLTFLAAWWGVGQAMSGFIAWGFMVPAKWNCTDVETCTKDSNWGWRYVLFTGGAIVLVLSLLRVTVVRLRETPKYLLAQGKDAEVVEVFQWLAKKYNRPCSLTLDQLEGCGLIKSVQNKKGFSAASLFVHIRGLFSTKKMGISTVMIWWSWTLIGLAYPLFQVFLPQYLEARGAQFNRTPFETWRNYALTNTSSIFGPMLAGFMCNTKLLGRKYTMSVGALVTMAFFFGYTAIRKDYEDVIFTCFIAFLLNIYYGCLYAYTPEVLPSAHRASGNGISVACNRIMGIISAVVATEADTATSAPIFVCAALFALLALTSALFPFEPYGRRSS